MREEELSFSDFTGVREREGSNGLYEHMCVCVCVCVCVYDV